MKASPDMAKVFASAVPLRLILLYLSRPPPLLPPLHRPPSRRDPTTCGTLIPSSQTSRCPAPSAAPRTASWSRPASRRRPRPSWASPTPRPWTPTYRTRQPGANNQLDFAPNRLENCGASARKLVTLKCTFLPSPHRVGKMDICESAP